MNAGLDAASGPRLSCDDLLRQLSDQDVRLDATGGRLRYDAPRTAMTPALLAEVRRHKGGLIARLSDDDPDRVAACAPVTVQQAAMIEAIGKQPYPQVLNVALRITIDGRLDSAAMQTALGELVARHGSLRGRFVQASDGWQQEILARYAVRLPLEDLTRLPAAEQRSRVDQLGGQLGGEAFDLGQSVTPRLQLLKLGDEAWVLFFVLHHITCDGWSVSVLLRELAMFYRSAAQGIPPDAGKPAAQSTDFAAWQRAQAASGNDEHKIAFWQDYLDGAAFELALPTDHQRPAKLSGRGHTSRARLAGDVRLAVEACARQSGATPFAVAASALAVFLAARSGQDDILLNVAYANRERREFESMVSCVTVGAYSRLRLRGDATFADLVARTGEDFMRILDHLVPMNDVITALQRSGRPVPDHPSLAGLAFQSCVHFGVDLPGLRVLVEDVPPPFARSELSFGIVPARDPRHGYETWAEFTTDLWDPATVDGWLRHYGTILMLACGAPEEPLGQLLATIRKTPEGPDNYLLTESSCQIGRRRRSP